jgi:polynucleotide 5'-hydroxyl-kinase GRC3/NOL9
MNRTVEKGKTLLVDGPASVMVTSGKVEVFGSVVSSASRVIIREGKRLPFAVGEAAALDISLGENGTVEEIDGDTIPPSWVESCEELSKIQEKPVIALVLGAVDSGKTSFCTYLANKALSEKLRIAILDGDLGQSDIGPPCTIAYAFATRPITDLFNVNAKNAFFVGTTSPSPRVDKALEGFSSLRKEVLARNPDLVVVNTDGWVEGEEAIKYKLRLVEELKPNIIFSLQIKDELTPLLKALEEFRVLIVDSPLSTRERSKEKRRNLRELGYRKYLRNAKVQSLPLSWIKIEDNELFGLGKKDEHTRQAKKIFELLGMKPLHFAELKDRLAVVIGRTRWIEEENIKKVEEFTRKKVVVFRKGDEKGLLTASYDSDRRFLGIGVLQEIDYIRKTMKLLTPVSVDVSVVALGEVKLDKNFKETPLFGEENQSDSAEFTKLF